MTCREKMMLEHPEEVGGRYIGGCQGCPSDYKYAKDFDNCSIGADDAECRRCWDQEVDPSVLNEAIGVAGNSAEKAAEALNNIIDSATSSAPKILDSGNRREFETGAVRDIQEGKGRCDLMPLFIVGDYLEDAVINFVANFQDTGDTDYLHYAIQTFSDERYPERYTIFLEVAKHFEEGAKKYGEHNWQKGIPVRCYIDSAVRHYLKHKRGDKDEPHDRAFVWNLLCAIWTCENKPELNDYAKGKDE